MMERTFNPADQAAFARISGDYNPVHMDELAARRLLFGAPVVHGVHALMWCLDALCPAGEDDGLELLAVNAVFVKPIVVGESVVLQQSVPRAAKGVDIGVKAKLVVNGAVVASISAIFRPAVTAAAKPLQPASSFPDQLPSRALDDAQLMTMSGSLPLQLPVAAAEMFPAISRRLPAMQLAVLLATTRVVGVHCPGLNSVFSELSLSRTENAAERMDYRVRDFDERFALASIDIVAPQMTGKLCAFRRPAVRVQPAYADFLKRVEPGEFAGCRALLVGGSRGLGEVAAKILCAGGADVRLTYHRGAEDANTIVADIRAHGGQVSASRYDIADSAGPEGLGRKWIPTHVLYFATPHIFSGAKGVFSPRLFNRFCEYFVIAFSRLFAQLNALGTRHFFLPSSSAIDELPPDMAEYVAAKAAAEHAARILEKSNKGVVIAQPRFPRLATDQTVTIAGSDDGDPVPVLLKALRDFIRTDG